MELRSDDEMREAIGEFAKRPGIKKRDLRRVFKALTRATRATFNHPEQRILAVNESLFKGWVPRDLPTTKRFLDAIKRRNGMRVSMLKPSTGPTHKLFTSLLVESVVADRAPTCSEVMLGRQTLCRVMECAAMLHAEDARFAETPMLECHTHKQGLACLTKSNGAGVAFTEESGALLDSAVESVLKMI
tara:strand:- start:138 stop:701 length:564 start_codon:yes stop_codon:yes gene_type:complete